MGKGVRDSIGKMIVAAAVAAALFAVIGLVIGLFWFSHEARPAVRTIRDAAAWTGKFYLLFFGGCAFSGIFSILMACFGGYKRVHWVINTIVTTVVGVILAALMYILFPTKDAAISVVASLLIFLEGFGIFFLASLFAPSSWVYNPLKG